MQIPPSAWRKAQDLISSSDNLAVDVVIRAIPRYHPICALLNQFCSLISISTSVSLRLNFSGLLPASLETFNKEDIFIFSPFGSKIFCIQSSGTKRSCLSPQFFCLFFSSSGTHQSHHLEGRQAIGINSFF